MASYKRSGGATYLPLSTSDLDAWEAQARADFVRKVFGIVFVQAVCACAFATAPLLSAAVRHFVMSHIAMAYIALFAPLVLIFVMFAVRHKHPYNYGVMGLFTLCTSYSLGVVSLAYSPQAVFSALVLTASGFGVLTALAYALRDRDLSFFGMGLVSVGWVFLLALLVLSFFPLGGTGSVLLGATGASLFSAYVVFDVWLMLQPQRGLGLDEHMLAAINLYLDLINLFMWLLQVIGGNQNQ